MKLPGWKTGEHQAKPQNTLSSLAASVTAKIKPKEEVMTIGLMFVFFALWIVKDLAQKQGDIPAAVTAVLFLVIAFLMGVTI